MERHSNLLEPQLNASVKERLAEVSSNKQSGQRVETARIHGRTKRLTKSGTTKNKKTGKADTWWFIPLSKWVLTPVISGLTPPIPFIARVITPPIPFITRVITHLLSGMSHQVYVFSCFFSGNPRMAMENTPNMEDFCQKLSINGGVLMPTFDYWRLISNSIPQWFFSDLKAHPVSEWTWIDKPTTVPLHHHRISCWFNAQSLDKPISSGKYTSSSILVIE